MPPIRSVRPFAIALLLAAPAFADPAIRAGDRARLEDLDAAAGETLRAAFAGGDAADLEVLVQALSGRPLPVAEALAQLPGEWSCRMIKLGGGLPIVTYPPFRCVADGDGGFRKLTGSQRTRGTVAAMEGRLVYLGTGYIAGDDPPDYADLPEPPAPQDLPQRVPEVGVVELTGLDAGRILMPRPLLESGFNILMLRR